MDFGIKEVNKMNSTTVRFVNAPSSEALANAYQVVANSIARQLGQPIELTLKNPQTNKEVIISSKTLA